MQYGTQRKRFFSHTSIDHKGLEVSLEFKVDKADCHNRFLRALLKAAWHAVNSPLPGLCLGIQISRCSRLAEDAAAAHSTPDQLHHQRGSQRDSSNPDYIRIEPGNSTPYIHSAALYEDRRQDSWRKGGINGWTRYRSPLFRVNLDANSEFPQG